jgi:WD40 repeat protein
MMPSVIKLSAASVVVKTMYIHFSQSIFASRMLIVHFSFHLHSPFRTNVSFQCSQFLEGHAKQVWFAQFSHDGKFLASLGSDNLLIVWKLRIPNCRESETPEFYPAFSLDVMTDSTRGINWSHDDNYILVLCKEGFNLCSVKDECWTISKSVGSSEGMSSCAWLNDSRLFVTASLDRHIILWDVSGNQLCFWETCMVTDMCFSTIKGLLYLISTDKKLQAVNLESKREAWCIDLERNATAIVLSLDSNAALISLNKPGVSIDVLRKLSGILGSSIVGFE